MQFEVATHRLEHEFGARVTLESLPYSLARRTDLASMAELNRVSGVEVMTRDQDGELLALFPNKWRLESVRASASELRLEPLVAAEG
jgi:peptide chain release factor 3